MQINKPIVINNFHFLAHPHEKFRAGLAVVHITQCLATHGQEMKISWFLSPVLGISHIFIIFAD